jgi:hypothetical protein
LIGQLNVKPAVVFELRGRKEPVNRLVIKHTRRSDDENDNVTTAHGVRRQWLLSDHGPGERLVVDLLALNRRNEPEQAQLLDRALRMSADERWNSNLLRACFTKVLAGWVSKSTAVT